MNAGGVSSLGSALGAMEDGEFVPSHHCEGTVIHVTGIIYSMW